MYSSAARGSMDPGSVPAGAGTSSAASISIGVRCSSSAATKGAVPSPSSAARPGWEASSSLLRASANQRGAVKDSPSTCLLTSRIAAARAAVGASRGSVSAVVIGSKGVLTGRPVRMGASPLCGGTTLYPGDGHRSCADAGAVRAPSTTHPRIYVSFAAPSGVAPRPRPRPASDSSGRPRPRLSPLGITALAIGALVVLLVLASEVWTKYLWMSQLGFTDVLSVRWVTQGVLFVVGFLLFAIPLYLSLRIAYAKRPVRSEEHT